MKILRWETWIVSNGTSTGWKAECPEPTIKVEMIEID